MESPAIVADFALAILVYAFVRRSSRPEMAFIAMLMVALNPAMLFDTVVWGQSDSVMTFVTLLSIVAILGEQYEIAWGLAAIAVLVKPQGLMMLPVLGIWTMLEKPFRDVDQIGTRADRWSRSSASRRSKSATNGTGSSSSIRRPRPTTTRPRSTHST